MSKFEQANWCQAAIVDLPQVVEERHGGKALAESLAQAADGLVEPSGQSEVGELRIASYPCPRCATVFFRVWPVGEDNRESQAKIYTSNVQCEDVYGQKVIAKRKYPDLSEALSDFSASR